MKLTDGGGLVSPPRRFPDRRRDRSATATDSVASTLAHRRIKNTTRPRRRSGRVGCGGGVVCRADRIRHRSVGASDGYHVGQTVLGLFGPRGQTHGRLSDSYSVKRARGRILNYTKTFRACASLRSAFRGCDFSRSNPTVYSLRSRPFAKREPGVGFEPTNSRLQVECLDHPSSPGALVDNAHSV